MFPFRPYFLLFIPILLALHAPAQAQTETILHNFGYFPQGAAPCGTVLRDSAGDLYGTTIVGGTTDNGVVFERTASGTYTVLYSFKGQPDGGEPNAGVVEDAAGDLYSTTTAGGASNQGAIYKLTPGGVETVLYSFTGTTDGANIYGGIALDAAGNLYGTAEAGGSLNYGTVWKYSAAGQLTVLHNFAGGLNGDGSNPVAGVTLDAQGNLYGTTSMGGATLNLGTVFKLSPAGAYTLLHNFTKVPQTYPESGLAIDGSGNLYGAVEGAVYEVTAKGAYTQFSLPSSKAPMVTGTPALDGAGNLYVVSGAQQQYSAYGSIFKVNVTSGQASTLYLFPGPPKDGFPSGGGCPGGYTGAPGVVLDASGNIYGDSPFLGLGGGIFEIGAATGAESTLYRFPAARGGSGPFQIARSSRGVIVGLTGRGGQWNGGALFDLVSGVERVVPLPFSQVGSGFGEDAQGNFYVCGGPAEQQSNMLYKITLSGESTLLYTFTDGSNCFGVTADAEGNVYGTTLAGPAPQGQVFRVSNTGEFTSLYVFSGGTDGGLPNPYLTLDKRGNVYGVTSYGGVGGGVIYRISSNGAETVLHEFVAETGAEPTDTGVALGTDGSIYGVASHNGPNLQGTIYKLSEEGGYTMLYAFTGQEDGGFPLTGVSLDASGNLYGTAGGGGYLPCSPVPGGAPGLGCGVVFEFSASGLYTVIHAFTGGAGDGAQPSSSPVLDSQGNIYGATSDGGPANYGVIYKTTPQ